MKKVIVVALFLLASTVSAEWIKSPDRDIFTGEEERFMLGLNPLTAGAATDAHFIFSKFREQYRAIIVFKGGLIMTGTTSVQARFGNEIVDIPVEVTPDRTIIAFENTTQLVMKMAVLTEFAVRVQTDNGYHMTALWDLEGFEEALLWATWNVD